MNAELQAGSILDLPIERQKEIAKEDGMEFGEWQAMMKKDLAEVQAFKNELVIAEPVFDENYTQADFDRFAKRMASCDAGIRAG